jgi:hypothetical protein
MRAIRHSGTGFEYCINCYDGCTHGCTYCYARLRRVRKYVSWINAKPRTQIVNWLRQDVEEIKRNEIEIKDIFICSACDAYQPLELEWKITRGVIKILVTNNLPFTVLTKNANVLRDVDLFKTYSRCRVGFSIMTLDEDFRQKLEPYSSPVAERRSALETLKKEGVSTICSVEPIMPCTESDPFEIVRAMRPYVDIFEFGKWSPYVKKGIPVEYDSNYYVGLFSKLIPYCEQEKVNYCIAVHSDKFLKDHGFSFIPHQMVTDILYPKHGTSTVVSKNKWSGGA